MNSKDGGEIRSGDLDLGHRDLRSIHCTITPVEGEGQKGKRRCPGKGTTSGEGKRGTEDGGLNGSMDDCERSVGDKKRSQ
ncbi:hypothetical protein TNCV_4674971 [Trichonephila clavipes]|nr:hypothetical protein TNCV_4674971 [Trichonephila clavipes]